MQLKNSLIKKRFEEYFSHQTLSFNEKGGFYFLECNDLKIKLLKEKIKEFLDKRKKILLVPARERTNTLNSLYLYLAENFENFPCLVINDEGVRSINQGSSRFKNLLVVDKEKILRAIDWKRLLPILNLKEIPRGKGTTVMAGSLFLFLFWKDEDFLFFQTDADILNPNEFKPLEYLTYGLLFYPDSLQVKMAQGGRNNEVHMAVRNSLIMLEDLEMIIEGKKAKIIAKRARELFENLAKYKWILSGTFALSSSLIFNRPFASGYLEETLICAFVEDLARKLKRPRVEVSNPNYCKDVPNEFKKEYLILQATANFLITLLLMQKPVDEWELKDIIYINKNLLSQRKPIALIPPVNGEGPVWVGLIEQERIFPSIRMLFENKLIIKKEINKIFKKYGRWFLK
jgi:hypothetical protein